MFIQEAQPVLDQRGLDLFGAWARGEDMPQGYNVTYLAAYDTDFPGFQQMAWALRLAKNGSEDFRPSQEMVDKARAFAKANGIDIGDVEPAQAINARSR